MRIFESFMAGNNNYNIDRLQHCNMEKGQNDEESSYILNNKSTDLKSDPQGVNYEHLLLRNGIMILPIEKSQSTMMTEEEVIKISRQFLSSMLDVEDIHLHTEQEMMMKKNGEATGVIAFDGDEEKMEFMKPLSRRDAHDKKLMSAMLKRVPYYMKTDHLPLQAGEMNKIKRLKNNYFQIMKNINHVGNRRIKRRRRRFIYMKNKVLFYYVMVIYGFIFCFVAPSEESRKLIVCAYALQAYGHGRNRRGDGSLYSHGSSSDDEVMGTHHDGTNRMPMGPRTPSYRSDESESDLQSEQMSQHHHVVVRGPGSAYGAPGPPQNMNSRTRFSDNISESPPSSECSDWVTRSSCSQQTDPRHVRGQLDDNNYDVRSAHSGGGGYNQRKTPRRHGARGPLAPRWQEHLAPEDPHFNNDGRSWSRTSLLEGFRGKTPNMDVFNEEEDDSGSDRQRSHQSLDDDTDDDGHEGATRDQVNSGMMAEANQSDMTNSASGGAASSVVSWMPGVGLLNRQSSPPPIAGNSFLSTYSHSRTPSGDEGHDSSMMENQTNSEHQFELDEGPMVYLNDPTTEDDCCDDEMKLEECWDDTPNHVLTQIPEERTLIVMDWDDTLIPAQFYQEMSASFTLMQNAKNSGGADGARTSGMELDEDGSMKDPRSFVQHILDERKRKGLTVEELEALARLANAIWNLMVKAQAKGRTVIVANTNPRKVPMNVQNLFGDLEHELEQAGAGQAEQLSSCASSGGSSAGSSAASSASVPTSSISRFSTSMEELGKHVKAARNLQGLFREAPALEGDGVGEDSGDKPWVRLTQVLSPRSNIILPRCIPEETEHSTSPYRTPVDVICSRHSIPPQYASLVSRKSSSKSYDKKVDDRKRRAFKSHWKKWAFAALPKRYHMDLRERWRIISIGDQPAEKAAALHLAKQFPDYRCYLTTVSVSDCHVRGPGNIVHQLREQTEILQKLIKGWDRDIAVMDLQEGQLVDLPRRNGSYAKQWLHEINMANQERLKKLDQAVTERNASKLFSIIRQECEWRGKYTSALETLESQRPVEQTAVSSPMMAHQHEVDQTKPQEAGGGSNQTLGARRGGQLLHPGSPENSNVEAVSPQRANFVEKMKYEGSIREMLRQEIIEAWEKVYTQTELAPAEFEQAVATAFRRLVTEGRLVTFGDMLPDVEEAAPTTEEWDVRIDIDEFIDMLKICRRKKRDLQCIKTPHQRTALDSMEGIVEKYKGLARAEQSNRGL